MATIPAHAEAVAESLGERLHAMREARDWTLELLAEKTGLSKAYLSRLECGDRQPSIAALLTVSKAFGVSIAALFDEPEEPEECVIMRGGSAGKKSANGLTYMPLSKGAKAFNLQPIRVTVHADRKGDETYQHDGEEWLMVTAGKLRLTVAGKKYELAAGDAAHFDSRLPHRLDAREGRAAELIVVACGIPVTLQRRMEPDASQRQLQNHIGKVVG